MAKIGVGIVGCGDIARIRYIPSLMEYEETEFVGVYDTDPERQEAAAREFGIKAYPTYEAFLADDNIQAVIVATYHPSHASLAMQALEAGKHVLTEKPVATSLEDAQALQEVVERARGIFMTCPYDSYSHVVEAKRLIQNGAIGKVSAAHGIFAHQGPLHAPWFFNKEKAGWGVLADLGIYPISLFTSLFGPAKSVNGKVTRVYEKRVSETGVEFSAEVEDNIAAVIEWPENLLGTVQANWCTAVHKNECIWELRVYGSAGVIFLNMLSEDTPLVVYSPQAEIPGAEKITFAGLSQCYRPHLEKSHVHLDILKSFVKAIKTNTPPPADGNSITRQVHVVEIIDKLYTASHTGCAQTIESTF